MPSIATARRYVFTLNNYSDDEQERLRTLADSCRYLIFGREVGDSGTPHLQGFVVFRDPVSFSVAKHRIGDRAHLEVTRGQSAQAADYCKKDGDFEEFGAPFRQGRRNDWDAYKEWVISLGYVPSEREIILHNTSLYARYSKACVVIAKAVLESPRLTESEPRFGWQTQVAGRMSATTYNARSIDFVVNPDGNAGKSWMCQYALTKWPTRVQVLRIGKRDDLAHCIDETKDMFLLDVPRGQMEFLRYEVLEMLKDKMVFSPKYNSQMKILRRVPYVAVFSNEAPDEEKLTHDRFNIINV